MPDHNLPENGNTTMGVEAASMWEAVQARRAEAKAKQESAIAQAVNDFLQNDLLGQASAYNQSKPDPNVTVRTVLDRATQRIQGRFDQQREVEAAIRDTIGNSRPRRTLERAKMWALSVKPLLIGLPQFVFLGYRSTA